MSANQARFFRGCIVVALVAGFALALETKAGAEEPGVFGQSTPSDAALMGIFYDLKQTQNHERTDVDPLSYWKVLDEYFSKHWDEAVLDRYYRCSQPLYTTQIFIPNMNADLAPKAFGADESVRPSRWVIHYKAQVSPPESGTFRFVGGSDDLIAVAVNGKTELISPLGRSAQNIFPQSAWIPHEPLNGMLRDGDWIDLKKDVIFDLDVIIGERPGGNFNAFLMIEKQGGKYTFDRGNRPILPIFQVAAFNTPAPHTAAPPFATGFPLWKSYQ